MKDAQALTPGKADLAGATPLVLALSRAFVAGFVASITMVVAFAAAFVAMLSLGSLPLPVVGDWFRGLTSNALIDVARPNLYVAAAIFLVGGLLWALLYGLVFEARLPGPGWQRGVLFAMIPWLFSLVVFLPLVGGGVLGMSLGAGPLPTLGNLILHVVYGAALGAIYGAVDSMEERSTPLDNEDVLSGRRSQIGAARGILVGLVVGIGLGLLTALVPQLTGTHALGMNPLALGLAMALIGASFGALVGSLQAS
ncbi:MAG TPA: DUF6789 family protein [Chloroflexota bacterium]|nr:DUF6789 family protein [Chloroflexota bacterium]